MKKLLNYRMVKYILIIATIITISLNSNISNALSPDIEIQWSRISNKEKHDLVKKLKVKKELEIRHNYFESDSTKNSIWIRVNEYNENGNQTKFQVYSDTIMKNPRYEEEYITDEMGNILEGYRKGKLIGTQEFDDEGKITERINYDGNGEACWAWKYEYDDMGNEIFETQYSYGELIDTILNIKFEYETINDKILIKSKECLLDTSDIFYEEKEFYVYDTIGREIQYQKFRRDSEAYLVRKTNYENLSRIRIFYFPDGSIEQIDSMRINSEGKVIESFTYKNGHLSKTTLFKYNLQGFLLSEVRLTESGKRFFEYMYNELGQEIYFKNFLNDSLNLMRSSNYLENSLIIESMEIDFVNKTTKLDTYEYEFY